MFRRRTSGRRRRGEGHTEYAIITCTIMLCGVVAFFSWVKKIRMQADLLKICADCGTDTAAQPVLGPDGKPIAPTPVDPNATNPTPTPTPTNPNPMPADPYATPAPLGPLAFNGGGTLGGFFFDWGRWLTGNPSAWSWLDDLWRTA